MKQNPFQLPLGVIFICGNMGRPDSEIEFTRFAELLTSQGFTSINPFEIPIVATFGHTNLQRMVSYMAMCSKVVTLPDWGISSSAKACVDIARRMEIEIINSVKFQ